MNLRDQITKQTAQKLSFPEKMVEDIIAFQWKSANEATRKVSSVEISGMGRFDARETQMQTKLKLLEFYKASYIKKLNNPDLEPLKKVTLEKKLNHAEEDIKFLNNKLNNEYKAHITGDK